DRPVPRFHRRRPAAQLLIRPVERASRAVTPPPARRPTTRAFTGDPGSGTTRVPRARPRTPVSSAPNSRISAETWVHPRNTTPPPIAPSTSLVPLIRTTYAP